MVEVPLVDLAFPGLKTRGPASAGRVRAPCRPGLVWADRPSVEPTDRRRQLGAASRRPLPLTQSQVYDDVTAACDTTAMRAPKLLCIASAVDLDFRYGCTPAWWQLWKGLHEEGAELVVAPYRGRPIETPWWRAAAEPHLPRGGELRPRARTCRAPEGRPAPSPREDSPSDSPVDRLTREAIWRWSRLAGARHLERLVERERPDAVVVFTVPMAHFRGIPTRCASASTCRSCSTTATCR